jgi:hypothetical protein
MLSIILRPAAVDQYSLAVDVLKFVDLNDELNLAGESGGRHTLRSNALALFGERDVAAAP